MTVNYHACSFGHDFQAQYLNTAVWFVCRRCGSNFEANARRFMKVSLDAPDKPTEEKP